MASQCEIDYESQYCESNKYFLKGDDGCIHVQIEVVRIIDPAEFYVSVVALKQDYKQLEEELQEHCLAELPPDEKYQWDIEEKFAVKLLNGKWCRGVLEELTEDNQMIVKLPDYCSTTTLIYDRSNLRTLNTRLLRMGDRTLRCHLGGLRPSYSAKWSGLSTTELEEFVAMYEGFLYMTKTSQGKIKDKSIPVELLVRQIIPPGPLEPEKNKWLSFNDLIRKKGYAKSNIMTEWDKIIPSPCEEVANILTEKNIRERMENMKINYINEQTENTIFDLPKWKPAEKLPNLEFVGIPSYVNEDCDIYLRDSILSSPILAKITEQMNQEYTFYYPEGQDLPWQVGQICCAQFYMDKQWHRAELLGPSKENKSWFMVRFVDYGNEDHAKADQLRQPICTDVPIQAHLCKLYKLKPVAEKWNPDHLTKIHNMIVDKLCRVKLVELPDGSYGIDSLVLPNNKEVQEQMIAERYARFICYGVQKTQNINFKAFSLPENIVKFKAEVHTVLKSNQVAVSFADTSDKQINTSMEQYEEMLSKMQTEAPLQPPIQPPYLYQPCCAQFSGDNIWYRAIVIEEGPGKFNGKIQYIDYGNTEVLDLAHVHEIKKEWAQVEIQMIKIDLDGVFLNDIQKEGDVMRKLYECLNVDCVNVVIKGQISTCIFGELLGEDNQLLYQELIDDGSLKKIV